MSEESEPQTPPGCVWAIVGTAVIAGTIWGFWGAVIAGFIGFTMLGFTMGDHLPRH